MSVEIKKDLLWLANAFESSDGKSFILNPCWSVSNTDAIFYVNACTTGIRVWDPAVHTGLFHNLPPPSRHIFWAKCLAICSAVDRAIAKVKKKIFIHPDSFLCFKLFSRHNTNTIVRPLFRHFIHHIVEAQTNVKVCHISGELNILADALSRGHLDKVS